MNNRQNFTIFTYLEAVQDIDQDQKLIWAAILLISVYSILFLGSCSPLHCRVLLALFGLISLVFAYLGAISITRYLYGDSVIDNTFSLPIILSSVVGLENIMHLCSSLDRVGLHMEPNLRI